MHYTISKEQITYLMTWADVPDKYNEVQAMLQGLLAQPEGEPVDCTSDAFYEFWGKNPKLTQSQAKNLFNNHPAPFTPITDDEIRLMAFNDCSEDWNSLEAKESWLGGYVSGATAMQKYMRAKK